VQSLPHVNAGRLGDARLAIPACVIGCPDGGVRYVLAGRLEAVRSPRNEAGERPARRPGSRSGRVASGPGI